MVIDGNGINSPCHVVWISHRQYASLKYVSLKTITTFFLDIYSLSFNVQFLLKLLLLLLLESYKL